MFKCICEVCGTSLTISKDCPTMYTCNGCGLGYLDHNYPEPGDKITLKPKLVAYGEPYILMEKQEKEKIHRRNVQIKMFKKQVKDLKAENKLLKTVVRRQGLTKLAKLMGC